MFFQLVVLQIRKKSQKCMNAGFQLNLLIEYVIHQNQGLSQKNNQCTTLYNNLVFNPKLLGIVISFDLELFKIVYISPGSGVKIICLNLSFKLKKCLRNLYKIVYSFWSGIYKNIIIWWWLRAHFTDRSDSREKIYYKRKRRKSITF
jgi:hypothetical protein